MLELGLDSKDFFTHVPGLKPCLTVQKKTFFPNLCQKIFAETKLINRRKIYSKTAVFSDFKVHLDKNCSISFKEDFQMFFSSSLEDKNAYDNCLEGFFSTEKSHEKSAKSTKRRTIGFEMVWKRANKFQIKEDLGVYQESVKQLPKRLSENKQEVGRIFLFQGGFVIFYSDLSK